MVVPQSVLADAAFERHEAFREGVIYKWTSVVGSDQTSWPHPTRNPNIKNHLPYSQPMRSTVSGDRNLAIYFSYSENYCADVLAALLAGRGVAWQLPDDCSEEYLRQIRSESKREISPGKWRWRKLHDHSQNHGWDCSKMSVLFGLIVHLLAPPKEALQPGPEAEKELQVS